MDNKKFEVENQIIELEQIMSTLIIMQMAFADGDSNVNNEDIANTLYLLFTRQKEALSNMRKTLSL